MIALYRPALEPLGLTHPQYLVMLALWQHGSLSVKELGTLLQLDSGTLSPLVRRLVDAGLVTKERAAADERSVVVSLSPAGSALRRRAPAVPRAVAARLGMSPAQLVGAARRPHRRDPRGGHRGAVGPLRPSVGEGRRGAGTSSRTRGSGRRAWAAACRPPGPVPTARRRDTAVRGRPHAPGADSTGGGASAVTRPVAPGKRSSGTGRPQCQPWRTS